MSQKKTGVERHIDGNLLSMPWLRAACAGQVSAQERLKGIIAETPSPLSSKKSR
jgi:hypothetical protein